jgi:hypothetical protein
MFATDRGQLQNQIRLGEARRIYEELARAYAEVGDSEFSGFDSSSSPATAVKVYVCSVARRAFRWQALFP